MLFTTEYCPSEWYSVFKKSQGATGSDSDQPVLSGLLSLNLRLLLFGQAVLFTKPR